MRIVVRTEKCSGCGECVSSCPFTAIEIKEDKAYINEYCNFCSTCLGVCPEGAIVEIQEEGDVKDTSGLSAYKGVWIFAEQREGKLASVALELLGEGRKLADERKTDHGQRVGEPKESNGDEDVNHCQPQRDQPGN